MSERLNCTAAQHTVACPECDAPEVAIRETMPEYPYRCGDCGATFSEAVVRPYQPRGGSTAKYGDLSMEDVDL